MFWNRQKQECEECKKLERRVSELEKDIVDCLAQLKLIRNKVLRRFRTDNEGLEAEETETIKSYNPFKV